jgi:hypothetical protein
MATFCYCPVLQWELKNDDDDDDDEDDDSRYGRRYFGFSLRILATAEVSLGFPHYPNNSRSQL